jgi:hypothetical protein
MSIFGRRQRDDREYRDLSGLADEPAVSASNAATRIFDRDVPFPNLDDAEFIYVETVRELGRERRIDDFAATEDLGATLMAANDGYGFGGVVRDSVGRPVTPNWLSAASVAVDGSHLAVGATVSHLALEHRSTALDLGARDGRNAIGWSGDAPEGLPMPNANLFLGDLQERWLEMSEAGGSIGSIDISPDGRQVALSEWWAGVGALVTVDVATGRRTVLGTLTNLGGGERVRFSPDGKFILVTRWADPVLVDTTSGDVLTLPLNGDIGWWPSRGSSVLIWLDQREEGSGMIRSFDLSTGATDAVQPIQYPAASGLAPSRYRLNYPEVDGTGTKVLCGTYFGVRPELQEEHGSRERVSLLDIETGIVEPLVVPHIGGDERLEREHHSWRWLQSTPARSSVALAPAIASTAVPASYELTPENYESAADQARNLTIACMRAMVSDSPDQGVALFAPEVLRALGAIQTFAPDRLPELGSWLDEVSEKMPIFAPPGQSQIRWMWFRDGWRSVKSGSTTGIEWRRLNFANNVVQTHAGDGMDESALEDERSGHTMAEVYVCIPIGESETSADVAMFESVAGRLAGDLSNEMPGRAAVLADRGLVREVSRRLQRDRLEGLASDAEIAQVIARSAPVGVFVTIGLAGDADVENGDVRRAATRLVDALGQGQLGPRLQAHVLTDSTLVAKLSDHFE